MNAITESMALISAAVNAEFSEAEKRTLARSPQANYADVCVASTEWLRLNLREFDSELRDEILTVAVMSLSSDTGHAGRLEMAIECLRNRLHDIASEGNDVEVQP